MKLLLLALGKDKYIFLIIDFLTFYYKIIRDLHEFPEHVVLIILVNLVIHYTAKHSPPWNESPIPAQKKSPVWKYTIKLSWILFPRDTNIYIAWKLKLGLYFQVFFSRTFFLPNFFSSDPFFLNFMDSFKLFVEKQGRGNQNQGVYFLGTFCPADFLSCNNSV